MRSVNTQPLTDIVNKQKIEPADVKKLRRAVFPRGLFSNHAADTLFHLHEICRTASPDWNDYYLSAMIRFALHETKPRGIVSEDQARFLCQRLSKNGRIEYGLYFELFIRLIEQASECPDTLVLLALDQVRLSMAGQSSFIRKETNEPLNVVTKSEVELLRRILSPALGKSGRSLTRFQAEFLMDLNDQTVESKNHASWTDLYVKSLSNFLICSSKKDTRDQHSRAAWQSGKGLVGKLVLLRDLKTADPKIEPDAAPDKGHPTNGDSDNKTYTQADNPLQWFTDRLKEKGKLSANETALIERLKGKSTKLHSHITTALETLEHSASVPEKKSNIR